VTRGSYGSPLVIVGDSLLDVDLDGTSERLCPDAPAPVLDLERRRLRPGGAGLAALLAVRAGAPVQLITGLGRDEAADLLLDALDGVEVLPQPLRGSTVIKTRIRLGSTPLVRVDSGTGTSGASALTATAADALRRAGAVLVSDYGRGLAWQPELRELLATRVAEIPLIWDPHPRGARPVRGATLATPNRDEAERAAPGVPRDHARGSELRRVWRAGSVVVTTGAQGAVLTTAGETRHIRVPAHLLLDPGIVVDTCGAGDRFAVAAAEGLRRGRAVDEAVEEAVTAAADFVRDGAAGGHSRLHHEHGPVTPIASPTDDAWSLIARTRRTGGRIVATGGCFDLLHRGHVTLLDRARELGDLLVVCLNSDTSVRRAKGPGRPMVAQQDRARVLASLASVGAIVVFDEDTPAALLERIRPDVWVQGELPETEAVTRHGGRIVLLPTVDGYSTTRLVAAGQPAMA
jgi:D-beta-D-heptose 7-phosphate kinase/D-beta-D-heptose 1-phosphate adenosyltransferase